MIELPGVEENDIDLRVDESSLVINVGNAKERAYYVGVRFKLTLKSYSLGYSHFSHITANRFAVANMEMATRTKIAVLIGAKEQVALYPNRHALLTFALGTTVLIAAMVKATITMTKTTVDAFIVSFHHLFIFQLHLLDFVFPDVDSQDAITANHFQDYSFSKTHLLQFA